MNVQMEKLKLLQLEMLTDIDKLCSKHNLKYYMIGGTLLGAVRHKGFIPWDDDLDIGMYRKDYEKIQAIVNEEMSDKYFVQNVYSDKKYPRIIAKIRLKGTSIIEKSLVDVNCNQGIYIDIFPLDFVKKNKGIGLEIRAKTIRYIFAYKTIRAGANNGQKMFLKRFLKLFTYLIPQCSINKLLEYVCTKDNDKEREFTTLFLHNYGWKTQMHKSDVFGPGERFEFENNYYLAPSKYDEFLTKVFGNYMCYPPVEKRVFPHSYVEIDFGIYEEMLNSKIKKESVNSIKSCGTKSSD